MSEQLALPTAGNGSAWDLQALQPQELVLTLLRNHLGESPERVWSGGLVRLLADFDFSTGAARIALSRLVQRELLAHVREGRIVYYKPTAISIRLQRERDERLRRLGSDPDSWQTYTLVSHTIPSIRRIERSRFAIRLRFKGFGSLHDASWLALGDHEERVLDLAEELDIQPYVTALIARPAESLSVAPLIERTWDLPDLAARYAGFIEDFSAPAHRADQQSEREAFAVRALAVHAFRQFMLIEPGLPSELAPEVAQLRFQAHAIFRQLDDELRDRSQRYFDQVTARTSP